MRSSLFAQNNTEEQSETLLFGALLTIIGGFIETYSYVGRGHVFANGQTGNMAHLGMCLAAADWPGTIKYATPIICFAIGVYFAEVIMNFCKQRPAHTGKQAVLLTEVLLVLVTAAVPVGELNIISNITIALICGLQMEAFRKIRTYSYNSTMCTGNLRSATEALYKFFHLQHPEESTKALHYYGVILIFIASGAVGGAATSLFGGAAILLCLIPIGICLFMLSFTRQ